MRHHHRWGKMVLLILPLLALVAGILVPVLRIEQIAIVAPTPDLADEVRRQLSIPAEASMLLLPLHRISKQAAVCYRVSSVSVRRTSPHALTVLVTAREPFAALRDAEGYTLVSREGICLVRQGSRPNLPVLTGLTPPRPPLGSRVAVERWRWALDLLAGATKVGLRQGLEGDFSQLHHVTVQTQEGWRANLGNVNSLERKVTILGRLARQLQREGRRPQAIDVSIPETPMWTAI